MNKVFWVQVIKEDSSRFCAVVSAPDAYKAQTEILKHWVDSCEYVDTSVLERVIDTDPRNTGKVVVKMHN